MEIIINYNVDYMAKKFFSKINSVMMMPLFWGGNV